MVDLKRLKEEQEALQSKIVIKKLEKEVKLIAGCDSSLIGSYKHSLSFHDRKILSVFVIFKFPELIQIEVQHDISPLNFPYIPGFLSFREIPNLLKVYKKIKNKPDLIMVDGSGLIHPRHLGIATHLGIILGKSTIGVAKKKLYGKIIDGKIIDPKTNEELGFTMQTKLKTNPLFISPGYMCDFDDAREYVEKTLQGYKLPEPTRIADLLSKEMKKDLPYSQ